MTRIIVCILLLAGWSAAALAQEEPGTLLSREPFRELTAAEIDAEVVGRFQNDGVSGPAAWTDVSVHLLEFVTTAPDGSPVTSVAQLFVPQQPVDGALLAFAPGSTGPAERCGPMAELLSSGNFDTYAASALAFAGQGFTTVLPDYQYTLGPDRLQPYFVAMVEAAVLIDALRAGGQAMRELSGSWSLRAGFVAGYSQGGHAVFAAADRVDNYAPDLPLAGVIGFGPSFNAEVLFRHFHYTAPWALWAYLNTYPDAGIDAADILAPRYLERLEDSVRSQCIAEAQNTVTAAPAELYTDSFFAALDAGALRQEFPEVHEVFAANDTGLASHGIPVLILQGVDDEIVPLEEQTGFVQRLCETGSPVRYANYIRTRHETRYVGFDETVGWLSALLDGQTAPDDCKEVNQ